MKKFSLVTAPFLVATALTTLSFNATNRIFHALGRHARRRGMGPDEVAAEWGMSLATARNLVEGRDFVRVETPSESPWVPAVPACEAVRPRVGPGRVTPGPPERTLEAMATIDDVQAAMQRRWPRDMPSWPDPHGVADVMQEEYSRVTDGGRYRIVVERARAWTDACGEVLAARVTGLAPVEGNEGSRGGWLITSSPAVTAPLRIDVYEWELLSVALGCGDAHRIETVPMCGCDACDVGSDALLEAVDDWFVNALTGGLAHIWGDQWAATRLRFGHACGGAPDAPAQLEWTDAIAQLDVIAAGSTPTLPEGLDWVWSGHWVDGGSPGQG